MVEVEVLENIGKAHFLRELYGRTPNFDTIEILELCMVSEAASLLMKFTPTQPPVCIPKKWAESSFNAAVIVLHFVELTHIGVTKFTTEPVCNFSMMHSGAGFSVKLGGGVEMEASALHCFVSRITGYAKRQTQSEN